METKRDISKHNQDCKMDQSNLSKMSSNDISKNEYIVLAHVCISLILYIEWVALSPIGDQNHVAFFILDHVLMEGCSSHYHLPLHVAIKILKPYIL